MVFAIRMSHRMAKYAALTALLTLTGCGGGSDDSTTTPAMEEPAEERPQDANGNPPVTPTPDPEPEPEPEPSPLDEELDIVIGTFDLAANPLSGRNLPDINDPLPQLGKKLFYSKSLGGAQDTACASCHHPVLGGGDNLSLPIGVEALNPSLLGLGRVDDSGLPSVPRNSLTTFNIGLWDSSLFWDSRIRSVGQEVGENGASSGIVTPDSINGEADQNAGQNLVSAQVGFPVTSSIEMKTEAFENGSSNQDIRAHLAARIGDYGQGLGELDLNLWLQEFQSAYASTDDAETLITFDNISHAIGEFERSMVFIDSPWRQYLEGDLSALNDEQKSGALLFFGDAGCASCHNGPLFSDGTAHTIGFPQIGNGTGDGDNGTEDFGHERVTGNEADRYNFRTPSLLNISVTAPYSHAGAYQTLRQVVRHYSNPRARVADYFDRDDMCDLPQFTTITECQSLYPDARQNTMRAIRKLEQEQRDGLSRLANINLDNNETNQLVAFLEALTDPCLTNRACMQDWIADDINDNPDGNVIIAEDLNGIDL